MDKMPGRADLSTAESEEERVSVLNHYMDILADMHSIDPKRFEEIEELLANAEFDSSKVPFDYDKKRKIKFTKKVNGQDKKLVIKMAGHSVFKAPTKKDDDSFEEVKDLTQQIGHLKIPPRARGSNKENAKNGRRPGRGQCK